MLSWVWQFPEKVSIRLQVVKRTMTKAASKFIAKHNDDDINNSSVMSDDWPEVVRYYKENCVLSAFMII